VATTGGALPEVVGTDGDTGILVPPDDPEALAAGIRRIMDDEALAARLGEGGRARVLGRFTWEATARGTAEQYRLVLAEHGTEGTTVPCCRSTTSVSGWCGARSCSTWAVVLAVTPSRPCGSERGWWLSTPSRTRSPRCATTIGAMVDAGEVGRDEEAGAVQGNALSLPFSDGSFDRVIASEVLEHIPDDTAAMAELSRCCAPGQNGRHGAALPDRKWSTGPCRTNTTTCRGGHVRIYRRSTLLERLKGAGLKPLASHHAHALQLAVLVGPLPGGPKRDDHPVVKAYHRLLVWDITSAPWITRTSEHLLNPCSERASSSIWRSRHDPDAAFDAGPDR